MKLGLYKPVFWKILLQSGSKDRDYSQNMQRSSHSENENAGLHNSHSIGSPNQIVSINIMQWNILKLIYVRGLLIISKTGEVPSKKKIVKQLQSLSSLIKHFGYYFKWFIFTLCFYVYLFYARLTLTCSNV